MTKWKSGQGFDAGKEHVEIYLIIGPGRYSQTTKLDAVTMKIDTGCQNGLFNGEPEERERRK